MYALLICLHSAGLSIAIFHTCWNYTPSLQTIKRERPCDIFSLRMSLDDCLLASSTESEEDSF